MSGFLLDISRTISRASCPHPTGIDRVERAYIEHFMADNRPVWFLSRVLKGYVLLDKSGMRDVWHMIRGDAPWQSQDLIARLFSRKASPESRRAESSLRRMALATCLRPRLGKMLELHLPSGFTYLNIGHANRKATLWHGVKAGGAARLIAMVHDVIPLDYPEYTRPDTRARFETELKATAAACDCFIYNSEDTAARTAKWLQKWGATVTPLPNLLGTAPLPPAPQHALANPAEFVILGTIEPRKNHRLLLDIWPEIPAHLHIIGQRGWENAAVFNLLDTSPMMGKTVFEHNGLSDQALSRHLSTARALLFPSFAEGFGYPLIEALQMGLPVICADLPCFREIAGDLPTYLSPHDPAAWTQALQQAAASPREKIPETVTFPTWDQHFAKLNMFLYNMDTRRDQKADL
jgi:glycosyltransferase involved in cell wall biosynthesis